MPRSDVFAPDLLAGRVALVTGGGTNLGRAAATELAACGARVVIAGRRAEVLADAAAAIGERCSWVTGDIREPGDCARLVETVMDRHGRLDTLLNNAGGQYFVPAEGITAKGWSAVLRLNVHGTLQMTMAAVGALRASGGGMIATVTVSPHQGFPAMAHTGAARAAVEAMTRDWAGRWAGDGIGAVALALGRFDTESLRKYPDVVRAGAARSVPLGRLGEMADFGWLAALVASPLGRAFSGTTITLDGAVDNWPGPWPPPSIVDDAGTVPTEERPRA